MHIAFVDESGDHALSPVNDEYPLFVMVACVFEAETYADAFVPALTRLKLKHWGHEAVVLHEREIRRPTGDFAFLLHPDRRSDFMSDIEQLVRHSGASLHGVIWDKRRTQMGGCFESVYNRCLEGLIKDVSVATHARSDLRWIIESRGAREDRQACAGLGNLKTAHAAQTIFVPKTRNLAGLQLADLCARPIGAHYLNPTKRSRAFEVLRPMISPPEGGPTCIGGLVRLLQNERGR